MDIITNIINNVTPAVQNGSTGAGSDLPEKFLSDLGKQLSNGTQSTNTGGVVSAKGGNTYVIKLPSLSNVLQGVNSLTVKTDKPIDNIGNFKIQADSFSFNNVNSKPTLNIAGTISSIGSSGANVAGTSIKFTSEVLLNNNITNSPQATSDATANAKVDGVNLTAPNRPNLLSLNAYTNNVSTDIVPKISNLANISNLKPNSLTSYNLQVQNFTYPSGKVVETGQAKIDAANLITGKVEFSAQNRETIIRTDFGNFRVPGELSIPNGTNVKFTINNISNIKPEAQLNESFNLNLNSVKFALEGEGSALHNLINSLVNLPHGNSLLSRLFPNFNDKQSFARSLWFISSSTTGQADEWLGPEGKSFIKANFQNSETIFSNLKEVFGLLKNLNSNPHISNNPDNWYTYAVPFYNEKSLDFVSFYVQPRNPNRKDSKNSNQKFIVEFEQSDLGQVVVEGMFHQEDKKVKNLDLQISSEKRLSTNLSEEIEVLFKDLSQAYNFNGNISFLNNIPTDYQKVLSQAGGDGIVI